MKTSLENNLGKLMQSGKLDKFKKNRTPRLLLINKNGLSPSIEYMHIGMMICNSEKTEITLNYKNLRFLFTGENLFPLMRALNTETINSITIGEPLTQLDNACIVNHYEMIDLNDHDNETT